MARNVTTTNGAATKKGKLSGNVLKEKNGMIKGRFPIIICKNLRDEFSDMLFSIFAVAKITVTINP